MTLSVIYPQVPSRACTWTRCPSNTCGNLAITRNQGVTTTPLEGEMVSWPHPGFGNPAKEEIFQDNPPASQGKWAGLKLLQFIKYPTACLYQKRMADFEESKSTILFWKCTLNILSHTQQKGSYEYIFLSGSTTDWVGQILLIETQEIFFCSGLQSPVPCCPKAAHHPVLFTNYLASS